jgi:hypothetical protein
MLVNGPFSFPKYNRRRRRPVSAIDVVLALFTFEDDFGLELLVQCRVEHCLTAMV